MAEVSVAKWGELQGISRQAAHKRVERGKVQLNANGKIDVDDADAQWEHNHDARQVLRGAGNKKKAQEPAQEPEKKPSDPRSLVEAQRAEAWLRVKRAKLQVDQVEGRLIDANEVRQANLERAIAEREALLNWPAHLAPNLAAAFGIDERLLQLALDREVRKFLAHRSSGAGNVSAA